VARAAAGSNGAVSRINDVGGMQGFGPVPVDAEEPEPFHRDWEARVFALNTALLRRGVYTLDEFRDAIERMEPAAYLEATYYERWFAAIRTLLAEKGVSP
jgi:nitrile hydratase subunit beta